MDLKGKRIVVTGGGSGIAEATVYAYVKEGARVVLLDINDDAGARVAQAACKLAGSNVAEYLHCDISHRDEVFSVFAQAVDFLGGLDALAMIAGIEQQKASEDLVEADLFSQISVHLYGTVFTNGAAFQYMRETGGSIINYSSIAGVVGKTRMGSYSAAKAAVLGFTRVVAQEWGGYRIRVNAVLPAVQTPLSEQWFKEMGSERKKEMEAHLKRTIPLGGKLGSVDDAANLNVFLASDKSSFMTGQMIGVDGGNTMPR